jgi:F0F1-type ATP synthase membrane subunit b/b'
MKATKIYYKRLINLGDYQNEEIGIELEVEPYEKAQDILDNARDFVNRNDSTRQSDMKRDLERAKKVLDDPFDCNYATVMAAHKVIEKHESLVNELPELPF